MRWTPTAVSDRWRSAYPETARSTSAGSSGGLPGGDPRVEEDDFAANPALVKGYIGPGTWARQSVGSGYLPDPRIARGSAWITGAMSQVVTFTTWCTVETSRRTAPSTWRRFAPATRARNAEPGRDRARYRDRHRWCRYADALGLRVQDESGTSSR